MNQGTFEALHQAAWAAFEVQLHQAEHNKVVRQPERFAAGYRRVCGHLALARSRGYAVALVGRLEHLALRGHQQLYRREPAAGRGIARFVLQGFAQEVRANARFVLVAAAILFGTLAVAAGLVHLQPTLAWSLLPGDALAEAERTYSPALASEQRSAAADWEMFGFYVMNNLSIAFQTFASGLLLGLGSLFYLFYNGLRIGAVAGHLSNGDAALPFWSFVAGHSAFELTAIALTGAAGLRLGWALVAPGRASRAQALKEAARSAVQLVYGAVALLLFAALIEAYWSSKASVPPMLKFAVGGLLWFALASYLLLAGKHRNAA